MYRSVRTAKREVGPPESGGVWGDTEVEIVESESEREREEKRRKKEDWGLNRRERERGRLTEAAWFMNLYVVWFYICPAVLKE